MDARIVLAAAVSLTLMAVVFRPNISGAPKIKGSRNVLGNAKVLNLSKVGALAGESLDFDPNGEGPYTGVADGRVLKWQGDSIGWTEFATTTTNRLGCYKPLQPCLEEVCGRPMGIMFEQKSGDLYIDDCYLGLMVVGPKGGLAKQISIEADGHRIFFTNHMDIDEKNDVIYFTDSSKINQIRTYMNLILSGDRTGRFLKYDKKTKNTTVLLTHLSFPNGVALSKDKSFVVVAESTRFRVLRYWLRGPKAGKFEVFAEVPGAVDNIRRNEKGEFWCAIFTKKTFFSYLGFTYPWFGKTLLKLFSFDQLTTLLLGGKPYYGIVIKLSENGELVEVLEDSKGEKLIFISEAHEKDGKLWLGSVATPHIGVYDLSQLN